MMKMTLNEEIEYLQSGNWYDKVRAVLPTDEYLKLGWAIGDILETLELFRSLAPEPQTNLDRIRAMGDEKLRETVDKYATAARAIALHLKPFCDESLPYDEMIADAARKASAELEQVKRCRWMDAESDDGCTVWHCSACSCPVKTIGGYPIYRHCPMCGARMDKEDEHEAG